eukprot:TRINITY_DN5460_c0_g2_i2.p1 TRINITY_DN5460_c0_g2~~TRINITY_DN5460_c0_g2_i2.p1  ORF type:complete len:404 (+),score=81.93 TRINITY_DN5460_c0_g2_i2:106-1317(+)
MMKRAGSLLKSSFAKSDSSAGGDAAEAPSGEKAVEVAMKFLTEHVALIVCSYCAPPVFEEFLDTHLAVEEALAIRQMMRGVGNSLSPEERQRFGEVIIGRPVGGREGGAEGWAARTGGLLHGDRELLREFVKAHPKLAEYLELTLINPFVTQSLRRASAVWAELHPTTVEPLTLPRRPGMRGAAPSADADWNWTPELQFDRIVVHQGRVRIRGNGLLALRRNLQERYSPDDYLHVLTAHERLLDDLAAVLVTDEEGRRLGLLERAADKVSDARTEEVALQIALAAVQRIATFDPQLPPGRLASNDLRLCDRILSELAESQQPPARRGELPRPRGSRAPPLRADLPGSRARRLREAVDRCQSEMRFIPWDDMDRSPTPIPRSPPVDAALPGGSDDDDTIVTASQ